MKSMDWIAWAAGLFEGEGCFTLTRSGNRRYPRATLNSTDPDILRRFHEIVGVGSIYLSNAKDRPTHYKQQEAWVAHGIENVRKVAQMFAPYLGERRTARLEELLAWEPAPPRVLPDHCSDPVSASVAGATAHEVKGEKPCDRCRLSRNLYAREKRQERRLSGVHFASDGAAFRRPKPPDSSPPETA